jgi:peroxiredoxin
MTPRISVGERIPQATLGCLVDGELQFVELHEYVAGRRVAVVGVPGAFTPICSCQHIPDLIASAPQLRRAGINEVIVVVPNSPWAVDSWAREVDPMGRLTFLSDGNLVFARALGLAISAPELMLGDISARYLMVIDRGVVQRLNIEKQLTQVACTRGRDALMLD